MFVRFFANPPPCLIGIESSNRVATERRLPGLGKGVRLSGSNDLVIMGADEEVLVRWWPCSTPQGPRTFDGRVKKAAQRSMSNWLLEGEQLVQDRPKAMN